MKGSVPTITRKDAAKELLARRNARRSLQAFTEYTHYNWQTGEHHRLICEKLEAVERGDIKRLMIFAPPRHSKSELASRRFPAWFLGRNPNSQLITCTYNSQFATDFGVDVRSIVRSPEYQNVFPDVAMSEDRKAAGRWNTTNGGFYVSAGIGGPVTGYGANLFLIDDPIKNRADADSKKSREAKWKWYSSTATTRMQPGGAIIMMVTRWHEDDLAGRAMAQGIWDVLTLPAIEDEGGDNEKALWPEWFPLDDLKSKRAEVSSRDWSSMYQQNPRVEGGSYIERDWFKERYHVAA